MTVALDLLHAVLAFAGIVMAVPAVVLLAQVVAAGRRVPTGDHAARRNNGTTATPPRPSVAVLVPAHDEAAGVAATIASIRAQVRNGDVVLVVADNCSDDTAVLARAAGADVVERADTVRRGKGFALDFGMRHLERRAEPLDVVVVVDADCVLEPEALVRACSLSFDTGRPVQATYLMDPPEDPTIGQKISAFAWIVRNRARTLGAKRLGWPCQLMGTGMAFPWALATAAPFASGHLVEDLQLGVGLALGGHAPLFCPEAVVRSRFPADAAAATVQRTRWEHGHLALLVGTAPRLAGAGIARRDTGLVAMALDLAVPPLAAWIVVQCLLLAAAGAMAVASGRWLALWLSAGGFAMVAGAVVLAWDRFGRRTLGIADLAGVPRYVVGKLPMYGRWFSRRETSWIRTRR